MCSEQHFHRLFLFLGNKIRYLAFARLRRRVQTSAETVGDGGLDDFQVSNFQIYIFLLEITLFLLLFSLKSNVSFDIIVATVKRLGFRFFFYQGGGGVVSDLTIMLAEFSHK